MRPLVEAKNLCVKYSDRFVLDRINLAIYPGEMVGLVGASGSGKSTLGRALLCLPKPTSGTVFFDGQEITAMTPKQLLPLRQKMQIIFQDPYSALNPRMTVGELIGEGIEIHKLANGVGLENRVMELLERVGMDPAYYCSRYPNQLSGGQRQRVCIARALAVEPRFIVCDEPLSALDVTMQMEVMELLLHLQKELGLSMLFISHHRRLVNKVCSRVLVMPSVSSSGP